MTEYKGMILDVVDAFKKMDVEFRAAVKNYGCDNAECKYNN